jgi:hypothetical protein
MNVVQSQRAFESFIFGRFSNCKRKLVSNDTTRIFETLRFATVLALCYENMKCLL